MHLSGWKVFRNKISPFSGTPKSVTIADILARMMRLGGVAHQRQIRASADLYLAPPLENFTFRDFSRDEEMAQIVDTTMHVPNLSSGSPGKAVPGPETTAAPIQ
jgi:hypothetical protein